MHTHTAAPRQLPSPRFTRYLVAMAIAWTILICALLTVDLKEVRQEVLHRARAEALRDSGEILLEIINNILDVSKIEARKLTLSADDFNVQDLLETTLGLLGERAAAKGLELTGLVAPDVPRRLRGDPIRLRQILTNLVSNAIKFTQQGEVTVQLTATRNDSGQTLLHGSVADTGIGIAPGDQSRLFQVFSQVDGSATRRFEGTGLGLAISRQLVELMGGQIGLAASTPGKGSTFWFTVPLQDPLTPATAVEPPPVLAGLRILIVDDNATNRLILEQQVKTWGMLPTSVPDAAEALLHLRAAAGASPFTLAILDLNMPGTDGLTLARRIKDEPAIAATRLVLLTSSGQTPAEIWTSAGMDDYIAKPMRHTELQAALARGIATLGPEAPPHAPATPTPPAPAATPDATLPVVDLPHLREASQQDPARLRELTDLFWSQAAQALRAMQAAVQANDADELQRLAHKIRGSATSLGMRAILPPLTRLEELGKKKETANATAELTELEQQLQLTRDFIQTHCPETGNT